MTPDRVKEVFARLPQLVVELDRNPSSRGPGYLQELISVTRGYLNETAHYLQEVMQSRHLLEFDLNAAVAAYEVQSDDLLANDRRVTLLPNIDDRKAMINVILATERRQIQTLTNSVKNLGHVEKAIRHRHKELENTMSAIRLQRSLVETEIRTGSYLGDETTTSRGHRGFQAREDDFDEEEIQRLFNEEANGEDAPAVEEPDVVAPEAPVAATPTPEPPAPQPVVVAEPSIHEESDEKAIARFLDGDDDFKDLFDSL